MALKKSTILFLLVIIFSTLALNAESSAEINQKRRWMRDLREYKQEFLIKELNLSKKQQDEFFPLYNAMEEEIYDVNKDARDIETKLSTSAAVTDDEYEKAANKMLQVKSKEAQIESFYYQKFGNILSKKQLFELQRAETRFSRNMLQHHKEAQKNIR